MKKQNGHSGAISKQLSTLEKACVERGLKLSPAKSVILDTLEKHKRHMSAEDIYSKQLNLRSDQAQTLNAIYRNLKILADAGVLIRRRVGARWVYYPASNNSQIVQLIDTDTGYVIELSPSLENTLREGLLKEHGYDISQCTLELFSHRKINSSATSS